MIVITIRCNDCNVFGAKDHRMTATSMRYYLREKGWNTLNSAIDLCPRCNRERKKVRAVAPPKKNHPGGSFRGGHH